MLKVCATWQLLENGFQIWASCPVLLLWENAKIPLVLQITIVIVITVALWKNYGDYFSQFQEKLFERNLIRRRQTDKTTFRPCSGSLLGGYCWVEKRWNTIARCLQGLRTQVCSRAKKAFQCTYTMGVLAPSLHKESTDSLISYTHRLSVVGASVWLRLRAHDMVSWYEIWWIDDICLVTT